jgi:hypothetical protein
VELAFGGRGGGNGGGARGGLSSTNHGSVGELRVVTMNILGFAVIELPIIFMS